MHNMDWNLIVRKAGLFHNLGFIAFAILGFFLTRYVWPLRVGAYINKARFGSVFWWPLVVFFIVAALTILIAETTKLRRKLPRNEPVFKEPSDPVSRIGAVLGFIISSILGWLLGITVNLTFYK
jgi:uncharacterized protein (DUF58 family)